MQKKEPNCEDHKKEGENGTGSQWRVPKVEPEIIQVQIKDEPPESEDHLNPMGSADGVTWLNDEESQDSEAPRPWLRHKSLSDMDVCSDMLDRGNDPMQGPGALHKASTNAECESGTSKGEALGTAEVLGYICGKCGKCFSVTSDLIAHNCSLNWNEDTAVSQKQPEVKNFNCRFCGKFCSTKYALQIHEFVHTGEKPYQCTECGKCFAQRSNLNSHRKTHTGVKPFKCGECGRRFLKKSNLQSHQKLHGENPFSCPECGEGFSTKSSLKKHKQTHAEST
ncbi:hypothetical protein XENTR_v10015612 [Xenopus tropicalis]|uniref:Oocyte zinc finger protein XlCOF19 n=1 Tax=Xenopus tropicalis TaxID=8364 RepID=A0A8J0R5X0_XENTR|nr:oocyte zinc finger protein XlCOF19 [Xenopus tropicalis]KAE8595198.1 hypothetical protein XENTR_v10015612 [Xenopus tropicalis]|eukprot:XP_004919106.1 PREDICTED: oocyte zinc finger protein XlCOF19 [Xenopus tropicalis]